MPWLCLDSILSKLNSIMSSSEEEEEEEEGGMELRLKVLDGTIDSVREWPNIDVPPTPIFVRG